MFLPLFILFLISSVGIVLIVLKQINQTFINLLIALGAGSMLSVSLVHILRESLGESEYAIYTFIAGFLLIYLIEELLTPHHHDHAHQDHAHEDPHEHLDHVAIVSFIAICIHTLFDGLAIRAGFGISETVGYAALIGIAIHQIPVSLSLAAIFRASHFAQKTQMLYLLLFALAAPLGFWISDILLDHSNITLTALASALAGGSLLYVATADLLPVIHSQTKHKYATVCLFLIGTITMASLGLFEAKNTSSTPISESQEGIRVQ